MEKIIVEIFIYKNHSYKSGFLYINGNNKIYINKLVVVTVYIIAI